MMHEAIDFQMIAKQLEQAVARKKSGPGVPAAADWRDSRERLLVLKLRWMGLDEQAGELEEKLGHSFATKLASRHRFC